MRLACYQISQASFIRVEQNDGFCSDGVPGILTVLWIIALGPYFGQCGFGTGLRTEIWMGQIVSSGVGEPEEVGASDDVLIVFRPYHRNRGLEWGE